MIAAWYPVMAGIPATAGGLAWGAYHPASSLFGPVLRRLSSDQTIALPFDDGPNPAITPRLLDLLDRHGARATFFVIGRFVQACGALTKEISSRGHLLGNHTQTHPNLFWLGPRAVRNQLQQCQGALQDATGSPARYFRPPYGLRNPWVVSTARKLGMQTVMWTLLPGDWQEKPVERLTNRMKPIAVSAADAPRRSSGDVLCLHDGGHRQLNSDRTRTLKALEYWLPRWRDLGLKFVTIGEAVSTPAG